MGGWEAKNALKGSRWIWLKNPENLTDKQRTTQQRIETVNLATAKAYQMRLTLQDIYKIPNSRVAKRKLQAWSRWVAGPIRKFVCGSHPEKKENDPEKDKKKR